MLCHIKKWFFLNTGNVECFGGECYALAFGVPAALMLVAVGKFDI